MIKITCSKCGRTMEAADSMAGQTLYCAGCQSPLRIARDGDPAAGTVVTSGSSLRMAGPNRSASGGKLCPRCGATMAENESVCASCGFDPRTGESTTTRFQRGQTKSQRFRMIILLIALAGLAAAAWRVYQSDTNRKTVSKALRFGREPGPQLRACTPEEVQAARAYIETVMERDYPMIAPDQNIEIELTTRQVIRGRSLKSEKGGVLSLTETDGVRRDYPYDRLSELSRARVDSGFRKQFIEKQVRKETAPRPVRPAP